MRIQTRRPMKIGYKKIGYKMIKLRSFSKLVYNYFMWGNI